MAYILIVEDNEMNRDMLGRRLERRGYEIKFALDGQEGLDMMKSTKPDLVLMDMGLPVLDGWQATTQAKEDPELKDIPIIALTAHALETDRQKALAAGADDFDTKPVDIKKNSKIIKILQHLFFLQTITIQFCLTLFNLNI